MNNFNIIIVILMTLFLISIVTFDFIGIDSEKCGWSEHNIYTNLTSNIKIFGNCYVQTNSVYYKTEKCGFLGISCRDVEPYLTNNRESVCFKLKTGELC